MNIHIRAAEQTDYFATEQLTREAFFDLYRPGCEEHYILHNLRREERFITGLDLLAETDKIILASIIYTRGLIQAPDGQDHPAITFGPVCVRPGWQKQGIGSALISDSLNKAAAAGFSAVLITGDPGYYHRFGFEPAARYRIYLEGTAGETADYFMVKLLRPGALDGIEGIYQFDPAYAVDQDQLAEFDRQFQALV